MLHRYRALGADLPFSDLRRAHLTGMDGYFWRLCDPRGERVIVALCGVCEDGDGGRWANVTLAGHPGGFQRDADLPSASADIAGLGVTVGDGALGADPSSLTVDLGSDARLDVTFDRRVEWIRPALGACGPAHLIPGLGQYWHPYLLGARVTGTATLGAETIALDGWRAYAEKNWSRGGFPPRWWWGQAQSFAREDVRVAFAGGTVVIGPAALEATAVVVALGDEVVRLGNPLLAPARLRADGRTWSLRARGPRWSATLDGAAGEDDRHDLPVPLLPERRSVAAAHQHFAGRVALVVRRRGRVAFAGESPLAGLELGTLPSAP